MSAAELFHQLQASHAPPNLAVAIHVHALEQCGHHRYIRRKENFLSFLLNPSGREYPYLQWPSLEKPSTGPRWLCASVVEREGTSRPF